LYLNWTVAVVGVYEIDEEEGYDFGRLTCVMMAGPLYAYYFVISWKQGEREKEGARDRERECVFEREMCARVCACVRVCVCVCVRVDVCACHCKEVWRPENVWPLMCLKSKRSFQIFS